MLMKWKRSIVIYMLVSFFIWLILWKMRMFGGTVNYGGTARQFTIKSGINAQHDDKSDEIVDVLSQQKLHMFEFVPNNVEDCKDLFGGNKNLSTSLSDELTKYDAAFHEQAKKTPWGSDGYTAMFPEIFKVATTIASFSFINTICETGFNTGHSTLGWLVANPKAKVYSFDLGGHKYSRPMGIYLQKLFPGRLNITWGNSRKTLPEWHHQYHVNCDLIVIDGGHSHKDSNADLLNFRLMANPKNIVIMDDFCPKKNADVSRTWAEAKKTGVVAEIFTCIIGHGFAVGRFIV